MENQSTWHLEAAQATRLNANQIPSDLFFQFKRNQPYRLKKVPSIKPTPIEKPPRIHTHIMKEFRSKALLSVLRSSSQCSNYRTPDILDSVSSKSSLNTSKIEKNSEKILKEIQKLLDKENMKHALTPKDLTWTEKAEVSKEYRNISNRISRLNRGKVLSKLLKSELHSSFH